MPNVFRIGVRWNMSAKFALGKILLISFLSLLINSGTLAQITLVDETENPVEISTKLAKYLLESNASPLDKIKFWYASEGFLTAEVLELNTNQYQVIPGCRFDMKLNLLDGEQEIESYEHEYSEEVLTEYLNNELNNFVRSGAYFAEIRISKFEPNNEDCEVEISANLVNKEPTIITNIEFEGNRQNSETYIRRRIQFDDSLVASEINLNQLKITLTQTELFESVSEPVIYSNPDEPVLQFVVEERALNQFDGVLGYVPNAQGNGELVGDLSLKLWSVFAEGNGLNLDYRRLEPEVSRLNVGVSQHWFGQVPLGLSVDFNFFQNDTTYQSREVNVDGYFELGNGLRLIGDTGITTITGSNTTGFTIEPGGEKVSSSFGFQYSSLAGVEVPLNGIKTELRIGVARKSTAIDSINTSTQRFIRTNGEAYHSFGKQSVLATRIYAAILDADFYTDVDLTRLGGANSIRGFTEEQFRASESIWGDLEYRFMTNSSSYLFAFGAVGWLNRPSLITEGSEVRSSTQRIESLGFGLSYKVRTGRLKLTYAISPTDGLGNGKIHVALTTRL